jgi:membrane protein involved in colicin uptake
MPPEETPQGETQSVQEHGTVATPDNGSVTPEPGTPSPVNATPDLETLTKELEQERKERQKAEMERNQLRNKQEEDRQARLKETEDYKTLYEESQAQIEEQKQKDADTQARKEAEDFRKKVIDAYEDESTRKAALALIAKNPGNLTWGDVDSFDAAEVELKAQLDAIREVVNPGTPGETPSVHSNNPAPDNAAPINEKAMLDAAVKSKNFDELLMTIPSIAQQSERVKNQ